VFIDIKNPELIILNEEAGYSYDVLVVDARHLLYELDKLLNYQWATKETILTLKALYLEVLYARPS
jgi:hypothetical protein